MTTTTDASQDSQLTEEQINSYHEKGYVKVDQMFDEETVSELVEEHDWLVNEWARDDTWTGNWEEGMIGSKDDVSYFELHALENISTRFAQLIYDEQMTVPVSQLLGQNLDFHHSTLITKPPEKGTPFPMHQDGAFYPDEPDEFVTVFIYLDDAPSEKGPLQIVEGSHKEGYIEHISPSPMGEDNNTLYLPEEKYSLDDAVELPGKAGDALIFNINAVHGSDINRSDDIRRGIHFGYRNADVVDRDPHEAGGPCSYVEGRSIMATGRFGPDS